MTTFEAEDPTAALAEQVHDRQDDLTIAITELASLLLTDEGLETTLRRVADLACRTMPGCTAAGVTLVSEDGRPETTAYTHDLVLEVGRVQYAAGDGPCLDALRHRRINSSGFAEATRRWPDFTAHAAHLGLRSFLAAPLLAADTAIGSLNLYSSSVDGFEELDDALVALFSSQAGIALANARLYRSALTLGDQLQEAMASRAVIEQAKGILMGEHRVTADAAFDLLRARSQHENRKLRDVAREVVEGIT